MMSESKNLRKRRIKYEGTSDHDLDNVKIMDGGGMITRVTGASKVLQDDHVHEALQNTRRISNQSIKKSSGLSSDLDNEFIAFSAGRRKTFPLKKGFM